MPSKLKDIMPSKLKDTIIEAANCRGACQPKTGQMWCGKWPFTKPRKMLCRAYHLEISGLFMTEINIKKFIVEITEPHIRTPHMAPWRERQGTVTWKLHRSHFILPWVCPVQPYASSMQHFCPEGPNTAKDSYTQELKITEMGWHNSAPVSCPKATVLPQGTMQTRGTLSN